jgi:hypothetical protein
LRSKGKVTSSSTSCLGGDVVKGGVFDVPVGCG